MDIKDLPYGRGSIRVQQESDHFLGIISVRFLDRDVKTRVAFGGRDGSIRAVAQEKLNHHSVAQGGRQQNRSVSVDVVLVGMELRGMG